MNNPLVSIFCVSYNHEQFIAQALDGFIMQQTNFDFEIVISDDCSTDNTRAIIEKYKNKYPHVFKDVSPQKNLGMQRNWIHTLSACTGSYIALCEGDDYWTDPNKLQKQVDFLEANEEYSFCCHRFNKLFMNSNEIVDPHVEYFTSNVSNIPIYQETIFQTWITHPLTLLFRAKHFAHIMKFEKKHSLFRDTHVIYYLLQQGEGCVLNFHGGVYRINDASIFSPLTNYQKDYTKYYVYVDLFLQNTKDRILKNALRNAQKEYSKQLCKKISIKILCKKIFLKEIAKYIHSYFLIGFKK